MNTPYVYIAVKDGKWCALLAHDSGSRNAKKQARWLRQTVGPTLGDWMARGYTVVTTHSREECDEAMKNLSMWTRPQGELELA